MKGGKWDHLMLIYKYLTAKAISNIYGCVSRTRILGFSVMLIGEIERGIDPVRNGERLEEGITLDVILFG